MRVSVPAFGSPRTIEMSQADVEMVRAAYESWNRRDFDAVLRALDPDIEWHQITQFPDRAVYRGHAEVRDEFWNGQLIEQFGDATVEIDELVDAGDHVAVIGHVVGHGATSGLEFRLRLVNVLQIRDGKILRAYDLAGPSFRAHE